MIAHLDLSYLKHKNIFVEEGAEATPPSLPFLHSAIKVTIRVSSFAIVVHPLEPQPPIN